MPRGFIPNGHMPPGDAGCRSTAAELLSDGVPVRKRNSWSDVRSASVVRESIFFDDGNTSLVVLNRLAVAPIDAAVEFTVQV